MAEIEAEKLSDAVDYTAEPPPEFTVLEEETKPSWWRVSNRQWIRNFRVHVRKMHNVPYKTFFGMFFWSFGYYPDVVDQESHQKYLEKYPATMRRVSVASDHALRGRGGPDDMSADKTKADQKSKDAENANKDTDINSNKDSHHGATIKPDGSFTKKKKSRSSRDLHLPDVKEERQRGSFSSSLVNTGNMEEMDLINKLSKKGDKDKKKPKPKDDDTASQGSSKKSGKRSKKKSAAKIPAKSIDSTSSAASAASLEPNQNDNLKQSVISGNLAYDPTVYDLATLTVMNLPPATTPAKLKKIFPGATITMEGGGASVVFPDAAAAEKYLAQGASMGGQALLVSPKLKA